MPGSEAPRGTAPRSPSRFLLLHGGHAGGWCWDPVRAVLEARGDAVAAPDLPGRDGRAVGLEETVEAACAALSSLRGPAVVVAHSMGGMPAALLAQRCGSSVAGVVFAAAVVPVPGRAVIDSTFGRRAPVMRCVAARLRRARRPPRALARVIFAERLDAARRRWLLDRLGREGCDAAEHPFPAYSLAGVPSRYVIARRDRVISPRIQLRFASDLGGEATVLDSGHSVFAERPTELAGVLVDFAERVAR